MLGEKYTTEPLSRPLCLISGLRKLLSDKEVDE